MRARQSVLPWRSPDASPAESMIEGAGAICFAILRSSVASDAQRTPTYASRRWLLRASSGSQLAPAPGRINSHWRLFHAHHRDPGAIGQPDDLLAIDQE